MNGAAFKAYVEQVLAPSLAPGDIVIMDNLSSHKVAGVREAIKAVGAFVLYLPPYSPTSIPSNSRSRSSRPCSEKPPQDRSTTFGASSPNCSTNSPRGNAQISSGTPDMTGSNPDML